VQKFWYTDAPPPLQPLPPSFLMITHHSFVWNTLPVRGFELPPSRLVCGN